MNQRAFSPKNLIFIGVLFSLSTGLQAQSVNDWLNISPSVPNAGVAGALSAAPDAYDEVLLNPGAIGLVDGSNFSLAGDFFTSNQTAEHFVYSQRLPGGDGFSFGGDYIGFGVGSAYGANIYGGYGIRLIDDFRFGLTAHFIYTTFAPGFSDQTGSVDAGVFYRALHSPLSVSLVMSDLGFNMNGAALPTQIKAGWAYTADLDRKYPGYLPRMDSYLTLLGQGDWSLVDRTQDSFDIGTEFWYKGVVALRAGYQFANFAQDAGTPEFSLGAGVRLGDAQVDYALSTLGNFGTTNQVSLSLALGGETPRATPTPRMTPAPTAVPTIEQTPEPTVEPTAVVTAEPASTPEEAATMSRMPAHFRKGMAAYKSGNYRAALKYLKNPGSFSGGVKWKEAEDYAMVGIIYEYYIKDKGHLTKARHYYRLALKKDPKNATARKHIKRWSR